jgi:hypothetical protein
MGRGRTEDCGPPAWHWAGAGLRAFGPALGNLGVVFRRVVRATED